jgi:hypothetical protein
MDARGSSANAHKYSGKHESHVDADQSPPLFKDGERVNIKLDDFWKVDDQLGEPQC